MPKLTPTELLKPLCTETTCDQEATGLYPVHVGNGSGPGDETPSEDPDWSWALLCHECAAPVLEANPGPAPATVRFVA